MILDNEDILIDNAKNPFLVLSEYLKDFDIDGIMGADKNFVKKVLFQLNPPALYNYKFDVEFKTNCIKLNILNSNYKFVCTVLIIKKYFLWNTEDVYLYFKIFVDFKNGLYGEESIIRDFLKYILEKYNFDSHNTLMFKQ